MLLLGPRECGKTTLAKTLVNGRYFDFEKPSDLQVLAGDVEADGVIHRGAVIYNGTRAFAASEKIAIIPASQALGIDFEL